MSICQFFVFWSYPEVKGFGLRIKKLEIIEMLIKAGADIKKNKLLSVSPNLFSAWISAPALTKTSITFGFVLNPAAPCLKGVS